jgi:hypothetical protein
MIACKEKFEGRVSVNIPECFDEMIAEAIGRAIRHANRVSYREHINADKPERINQFCTSLRRELGYLSTFGGGLEKLDDASSRFLINNLCHKEYWYDIGHIASFIPNLPRASMWVDLAKRLSYRCGAQSEIILGDLEELERGVRRMQTHVSEATRINEQGDRLIADLEAVFN